MYDPCAVSFTRHLPTEKARLENIIVSATVDRPGADGHLAAIHALWTLDGLQSLDKSILLRALQHNDPRVCQQAVRISEPYIKEQDTVVLMTIDNSIINGILRDFRKSDRADVKIQLTASLSLYAGVGTDSLLQKVLESEPPESELPKISESVKAAQGKLKLKLQKQSR